jgi:hypothetical protein
LTPNRGDIDGEAEQKDEKEESWLYQRVRADSCNQNQLCLEERIRVLPLFIRQKSLQRSPR